MVTAYIQFKPTSALSYKIIWKDALDPSFPIQNVLVVAKQPGVWNYVQIQVASQYVDIIFAIMPICDGKPGIPFYGVIIAVPLKVTFVGSYSNCACPLITNISYTLT